MAYGFYSPGSLHDSLGRAAMQPGGAVDGLSALGQALLADAREKRERQMQINQMGAQRDFQNRQLQQALDVANQHDRTQRYTADKHYDTLERWRTADANERATASAAATKERGEAAAAATKEKATHDSMQWGLDAAKSAASGLWTALGGNTSSKAKAQGEKEPDVMVDTYDAEGHKTGKRILTDDEVDRLRAAEARLRNGPPTPLSSALDPAAVRENQARSAAVRQQQRQEGLAQGPGDPEPAPSQAGVREEMPLGGQPTLTPPAAAPTKVLRVSKMQGLVRPPNKDGTQDDGTYPDLATAVNHAKSLGYQIMNDSSPAPAGAVSP